MSSFLPRSRLSTLDEARAWLAGLALGPPAMPPAAPRLPADLVLAAPVPSAPVARRAGWAVPAEATLGASPYGPVPLAGLRRVAAGEPMPPGTDAVLPPEQATDQGPWCEVTGSVAPGEGVVGVGEHLAAGQVLARAGSVPSLLTRLLAAVDDAAMVAMLANAAPPGLTLGPVAAPVHAGLAARPIEETVLGASVDGRPAIALPADPAARLLAWCALLAPDGGTVEATLTRKLPSAVGLTDLVPMRLVDGIATPLASADSPRLGTLPLAAGWLEVPPASEGYPEGARVTLRLFPAMLVG